MCVCVCVCVSVCKIALFFARGLVGPLKPAFSSTGLWTTRGHEGVLETQGDEGRLKTTWRAFQKPQPFILRQPFF